jgi:hypothetical protein
MQGKRASGTCQEPQSLCEYHNKENNSNHARNETSTLEVITLLPESLWFQNLGRLSTLKNFNVANKYILKIKIFYFVGRL